MQYFHSQGSRSRTGETCGNEVDNCILENLQKVHVINSFVVEKKSIMKMTFPMPECTVVVFN